MDSRIRILLQIIDERGGTLPMGSKAFAGLMGLGEAHVLRLFGRDVGKPLRQHMLEVRMARAAQLLNNLALPIKTIGSDCGYSAVSNFYRDFKRIYGVTPMKMRLAHLHTLLPDKMPALSRRPILIHPGVVGRDQDRSLRLVAARGAR